MKNRKIVLDTETTGINKVGLYYKNHRIIEIGAVEIIDRKITGNEFHCYINPNRNVDYEAYKIHRINNIFLKDKPSFKDILNNFIKFIYNSELIIHNAKFDIDFINYELSLIKNNIKDITNICDVTDSLKLARKKFPRKRNSLSALCERYKIKKNIIHGALLDSKVLAKVFLLLTGGQTEMNLDFENLNKNIKNNLYNKVNNKKFLNLKIIYANENEINEHKKFLKYIEKKYKLG